MLTVGDPVPDFALASDTTGEVKAADLRGQRWLLYFYPRDDTPGCTVEACSFRDNMPDFSALSVPVFGISADDVDSHSKSREKFNLTFPLLADTDHRVAEAFGAWVEKNNYGKKYMGIQRSTFVVGADGHIEQAWPKVTPAEHVAEVLAYLRMPMQAAAASTSEVPASVAPAARKSAHKAIAKKAAKKAAKKVVKKPARKVAAKKSAARKTASKKTAAKKSVARKGAAKKSAAKKSSRR